MRLFAGALLVLLLACPANAQDGAPDLIFSSAEEAYRFAEGHYRRQHYERAAQQFELVVQSFPQFDKRDKACFLWAESLRLAEQFDLAGRVYVTVVQTFPESEYAPRSAVVLGSLLIQEGKLDNAMSVLDMGLKLDPPADYREELHYFLGVCAHRKGDSKTALEHFSKLPAAFDAEHAYRAHARLNLGYLLRAAGKNKEAAAAFEELVQHKAVEAAVIEEALFQLGDLAFAAKDYQEAARYYRQQLDAYPLGKHSQNATVELAWSLYNLERYSEVAELLSEQPKITSEDKFYLLGSSSKQMGLFEAAAAQFDALLQKHPEGRLIKHAKFDLVECAFRMKRYDEAIGRAKAFLQNHAGHEHTSDVSYFLAYSLYEADRHEEAALQFESLLDRAGPTWEYREDALFMLADIYAKLNRSADSAAALRQVMAVEDSAHRDRALLMAAEAAQSAANLESAITDYKRFLEAFPDSKLLPNAMLQLADLLTRQNDPEAADVLGKFLAAFPKHAFVPRAHYLRGNIHYNDNRFSEAISDFRQATSHQDFPERDFARLMLAYSLWEEGVRSDAPEHGKEALEVFAELIKLDSLRQDFVPDLLQIIGQKYVARNNLAAAARCYELLGAHEDLGIALIGQLGGGKIAFRKGDFEAARIAFNDVRTRAGEDEELQAEAISYLGETLRRLGRVEEAHVALRDGLALKSVRDTSTKSRLLLALARVLLTEGESQRALDYASSVYFVYNDPEMAPEAMVLALQIETRAGKMKDACAIAGELTDRYPGTWARFRADAENAELVTQLDACENRPPAE